MNETQSGRVTRWIFFPFFAKGGVSRPESRLHEWVFFRFLAMPLAETGLLLFAFNALKMNIESLVKEEGRTLKTSKGRR